MGPLVVPVQVALLLAGVMLAHAVAAWLGRRQGGDPATLLWQVLGAGLVAGRLVFVLRHHELYFSAPLSVVDVRDGGFDSLAGLAIALIAGVELSRRTPMLRRPLLAAALTGGAVFYGGAALNHLLTPQGAPIPAVALRRLDGTAVSLDSFAGRPVVINLWATWCPPCRREMPVLQAAQLAHPEIHFVLVNQGESAAAVQRYLDANGLRMSNVVLDPANQVSARTGASGYPTTLFYDAQGRLHQRHMGELSPATLRDKMHAVAGARTVQASRTPGSRP